MCTQIGFLFRHSEQFMYTTCSELEIFMNNLSSYCGLVDARIIASEQDLPVKAKNSAARKFIIRFSIDNYIANISLCALTWPKLNLEKSFFKL